MKNIIATFAITLLVSQAAFAETETTTTTKTTKTTRKHKKAAAAAPTKMMNETTTTSASAAEPVNPRHNATKTTVGKDLDLSATAGLGTIASNFHFGATFKAEVPVNFGGTSLMMGGQAGIFYGSLEIGHDFIIPILATAKYTFDVSGGLVPYAGIGLGIDIGIFKADGFSDTQVAFTGLVTPGVNFNSDGKYFFEIPFGTMAKDFAILPQFGMHF